MMLFISWDGDNVGKVISRARMGDDPEELRRIGATIDSGNDVWKSWAVNHGGSLIAMGGDEGQVEVPATALIDLPSVKSQYEGSIKSTVSVGVGIKLSESFKALLAAKLRGKNRVVMYDDEVGKEIAEASEDDEKKKIVTEYLTKHQPEHRTGKAGEPGYHRTQPDSNPEIQQKRDLSDMPDVTPEVPEDKYDFEAEFRKLADDNEKKQQAQAARRSTDINALKQKVSGALLAIHQQLPVLGQIKQAAPETYQAILGLVQGVVAIGRQLSEGEQQLAKAMPKKWMGGGSTIPALGTPQRSQWDKNYRQAVANYFTEGDVSKLKPLTVHIDKLQPSHVVFGNEAKTRLYHRMVRAGDKMPPLVVTPVRGGYRVVDGHRRLDVARANGLTHLEAFLAKTDVNITHNPALPPTGMGSIYGDFENYDLGVLDKQDLIPGGEADSMRPEDFDQEQLAIGTQHEMEHTDDQELAREIAMDHLSEDPDYYKPKEELEKAISGLKVGKQLPKASGSQMKNNAGVKNASFDLSRGTPVGSWDYSHLLTPRQRSLGYSLRVDKIAGEYERQPTFIAGVFHNNRKVGDAFGKVWYEFNRDLEPHSEIQKAHRGKGLGVKVYEALYAHARNVEGVSKVQGGMHSEAAHRVHLSLARKHGLDYKPTETDDPKYPYDNYSYTLKDELRPDDQLDESNLTSVQLLKAISDIPKGKEIEAEKLVAPPGSQYRSLGSWDYSHMLTPEQRQKGLSLKVHKFDEIDRFGQSLGDLLISHLTHNSKGVGRVHGYLHTHQAAIEPHSNLHEDYRGQGLGTAMYEAMYAHALQHEGISKISGGVHSEAAHRVHLSLARKHGLQYTAYKGRNISYPYKSYEYTLKDELRPDDQLDESNLTSVQLLKAIADIPKGTRIPSTQQQGKDILSSSAGVQAVGYPDDHWKHLEAYDYNHVLSPEQRQKGYSLRVDKYINFASSSNIYVSSIHHNGKKVGDVFGIGKGSIEPHSYLNQAHQGRGLGTAMYEALYAHVKNVEGGKRIGGGYHSEAASKVHQRLAQKHGLEYVADRHPARDRGHPYKPYSYALKAEMPSTDQLDESNLTNVYLEELDPSEPVPPDKVLDKGDLSQEHVASIRQHRKLVPGEVLDSRHVVVQTSSGKNAVREVSSGQKRDLSDDVANPVGPGQGNPTSTRNKPSREAT